MTITNINNTTTINGNTFHTIGEVTRDGTSEIGNTITYENGVEIYSNHFTNNVSNGIDTWSNTITEEPSYKIINSHGTFNI